MPTKHFVGTCFYGSLGIEFRRQFLLPTKLKKRCTAAVQKVNRTKTAYKTDAYKTKIKVCGVEKKLSVSKKSKCYRYTK